VEATSPPTCRVVTEDGASEVAFDREAIEKLLAGGGFFWLDLDRPDAADFEILTSVFGFHPLAVEDSEHFGQRAKLDEYDDFVFIVVYGAAPDDDRLVEVHCFYSEHCTGRTALPSRSSASATRSGRASRSDRRFSSTG